jgi:hypothetical protein
VVGAFYGFLIERLAGYVVVEGVVGIGGRGSREVALHGGGFARTEWVGGEDALCRGRDKRWVER